MSHSLWENYCISKPILSYLEEALSVQASSNNQIYYRLAEILTVKLT